MKSYIQCKIEEIKKIKESREVFIKVKSKKQKEPFIVFFTDEKRFSVKKGDSLDLEFWSCIHLKKSTNKKKEVKIVNGHLANYNGPIVGEVGKFFLVDANLPILIDKEPNFNIGDYVTAKFNHSIQGRIDKSKEE